MKLRITPRALAEAKRIKTWWRRHREAAPDLFEQEFEAVLARALLTPALGAIYEQDQLDVTVRRTLMPRTHHGGTRPDARRGRWEGAGPAMERHRHTWPRTFEQSPPVDPTAEERHERLESTGA